MKIGVTVNTLQQVLILHQFERKKIVLLEKTRFFLLK
jgi:hypothetical protein